jgi:alanine dehydrogenase
MDIGIPAEVTTDEFRVGLTPRGVSLLTQTGHRCYIQRGAGEGAGFANQDYERAGGLIVYGAQEVYRRADLVLKVGCPTPAELDAAPEGQTICAFWHLAARAHDLIPTLVERRITAIAYEAIQTDHGMLPVLHPLSQIAGRMSPQIAAHWLQNDGGGSGVLISGIAGIPPVTVCILGAGVVGTNAAIAFHGLGARVTVLDNDLARLQQIEGHFRGQVTTMVAYNFNIARAVRNARVLIGAVLERGQRAPVLVTREMVRSMRPNSVILDISIDEGGCVETSRPMTHADPVFVEEGVIHYCVPNMPGVVARTATNAYLNAAWPYIQRLAAGGAQAAMDEDESLRRGVMAHDGTVLSERLASLVGEAGQER